MGIDGSGDVVRLLALRETPLSVDEVLTSVRADGAGGTALFLGTVRDSDGGRSVVELEYAAHPSAEHVLRQVVAGVAKDFPVLAVAAVHRIGTLRVGDSAVVVAAACPHRAEAIAACRRLIDDLKARVPIWKRQVFVDGTDEWVGCAHDETVAVH